MKPRPRLEFATAHESGDCIPHLCSHPDHDLEDADVDLTYLLSIARAEFGLPPEPVQL